MKGSRVAAFVEPREKQSLPQEIVGDLLRVIRGQFCVEMGDKEWFQHRRMFLRVVTFPASWLNRRGVWLPAERYKAVLLGIFDGVKRHGTTRAVSYWPGYLLHCVQEHFKHHGDELYEEAKSVRYSVEKALTRVQPGERPESPTDALAQVSAIISRRRPRIAQKPEKQLGLL